MRKTFLIKFCVFLTVCAMALNVFVSCNNGDIAETTADGEGCVETTEAEGTDDGTEDADSNTTVETTDGETTEATDESTDETTDEATDEDTTESEETDCYHPYAATPEGHYKPACDVCGKADGKIMSHEWEDDVEDEGDLLLYSYYCRICRYIAYEQEVSYNASLFIAPSDFYETSYAGFADPTVMVEGGVAFARFTALAGATSSYVSAHRGTEYDDPSGRYMVIKIRVGGARSSFKVALSSITSSMLDVGAGNTAGRLTVTADGISSGWSTAVIDLAAAATDTKGYIPDASGSYYVDDLRIVMEGTSMLNAGESVDIAYIMLCDTLEEASEFALGAALGYYKYDNILQNSESVPMGSVCSHKFTYTENTHSMEACDICGAGAVVDVEHDICTMTSGDKRIFGCACGYELHSMTVSKDVNLFFSAENIAASASAYKAWSGAEVLYEHGTEAYARIYGKTYNDLGNVINDAGRQWNLYEKGIESTGRFLIIKYRVGDNGLGQTVLQLYSSTTRAVATDEMDGFKIPVVENGGWMTVVVDLARATGNDKGNTYHPDQNGDYKMTFLQIRLFSLCTSYETSYTDIAFVACCDSLDEARSLVSDETFYYKTGINSGATIKANGECLTHSIVENREGENCEYVCTTCNNVLAEKQIPASVNNFYSTDYVQSGAAIYYQLTAEGVFVAEDGVPYSRLIGQGMSAAQIIWTRLGYAESQIKPIEVGEAKYLVIKMRSNNDINTVTLRVGTILGEVSNANQSNEVYADILIPQNVLYGDEWTTFVIDLSTTMGAGWRADSDGNYTVSCFQITFGGASFNSETYFDFSYIAFCDSLEEINALVDDDKVNVITGSNTSREQTMPMT